MGISNQTSREEFTEAEAVLEHYRKVRWAQEAMKKKSAGPVADDLNALYASISDTLETAHKRMAQAIVMEAGREFARRRGVGEA